MVDELIALDENYRAVKTRSDFLRGQRNTLSKQIGGLMAKGQKKRQKNQQQVTEAAKNFRN